jgi:hypothetical protein
MTDDGRQRGRPNSSRLKAPVGPLRVLVIGLLAARALGWHDLPPDSARSVTVTVTSYRICLQRACNRIEPGRLPSRGRVPALGGER